MNFPLKKIKEWLPPELIRLLLAWTGRGICFHGDYSSWEEASESSEGYADQAIIEKVLAATLAVREGRAAYERDGVLFDKPDYAYPMLAALMRSAALNDGNLDVLDFGGALGSSYFQCRPWFTGLRSVRWRVVEQAHYVTAGRKHIADGALEFLDRIEDCRTSDGPNTAVISGVLQYVSEPATVIQKIAALGTEQIIIDRTPIIDGERSAIAIQKVPKYIVRASYPVWLFSQAQIESMFGSNFRLIADFPALDGTMGGLRRRIKFKGFIFERTR